MSPAGPKILLVDDSRVMRAILKRAIAGTGRVDAVYLEADNGEAALETLEQASYEVDVIFCDLCMPVLDGLGLLAALKERGQLARCPVIVVSGDMGDGRENTALDEGATAWIAKPFTPESIGAALDQVLSR